MCGYWTLRRSGLSLEWFVRGEEQLNWLLGVIAVLLLLDLILRVVYVRLVLRIFEAKPPFSAPTLPPHPMAEMIEFPTGNGLVLELGSTFGSPQMRMMSGACPPPAPSL